MSFRNMNSSLLWSVDDLDLLASDLDSSLTGLGGPVSSTFDMSDTLSAIQVIKLDNEMDHKQESHSLTFSGSVHQYMDKEKAKSSQDLSVNNFTSYSTPWQETRKVAKKPCRKLPDDSFLENRRASYETDLLESVGEMKNSYGHRAPVLSGMFSSYAQEADYDYPISTAEFQYRLSAATALGTRTGEEALTYLNQGQSYEIRLKKLRGIADMKGKLLKSVLQVTFHDRRLQFREKLEILAWQNQRPSERILDIDLSLSYGIFDVIPDPKNINCVEFMWDPTREASVFLKVNCISTEFTCKRRGGEKGVPFRILIETYSHWENPQCLLDAASCLVKVFKSKGADRKHKTDRDKYEKLPQSEQRDLQPSYQYTLFTASPLKAENKSDSGSNSPSPLQYTYIKPQSPLVSTTEVSTSTPSVTSSPQHSSDIKDCDDVLSSYPDVPSSPPQIEEDYFNLTMSPDQVRNWFHKKKFNKFLQCFALYSAKELLCLSREDIIEICGPAEGIRLYNCFHIREPPPLRKFYISRDKVAFSAIYLHSLKLNELKEELCKMLNLPPNSIANLYASGPDGILLIITNKVLQNMKDEAIFICEILKAEDDKRTIILKSHKNIVCNE
ncbi:transcription factor CP2 isoform X1 [Parasteatoda tepidariorum]|uniref:transcription factor CP2 isoform X1 n=2 Tax=Parasteatoda tepidariorum TaxID=114398 RepID=UPI0039BD3924